MMLDHRDSYERWLEVPREETVQRLNKTVQRAKRSFLQLKSSTLEKQHFRKAVLSIRRTFKMKLLTEIRIDTSV